MKRIKRISCYVSLLFLCARLDALSIQTLFSKITITSDQATCSKDVEKPGFFVFQYQKNVVVTFADNSTVTADSLEIVFGGDRQKNKTPADKKNKKNGNKSDLSNFKQITFKNNVCIKNAQRTAQADRVILTLQDQRCVLDGNVKIIQAKQKEDDVPVQIKSQKAELNMLTGEVNFSGSLSNPVHTTVQLDGHPALRHAKKEKKSKKK